MIKDKWTRLNKELDDALDAEFGSEEPKQFVECKCTNSLQAENCIRNCGHGEEPKQETLEESAKKYAKIPLNRDIDSEERYFNSAVIEYDAFIKGAEWQQERMYSEEDVDKLISIIQWYDDNSDVRPDSKTFIWFEQFKKK